jgi:E3 UFM1-protein ligase 1
MHRLNERNVVDIVNKLLESKRLQLIYTQDGKEYLTQEQVRSEIISLVRDEGCGKMNLKDIP